MARNLFKDHKGPVTEELFQEYVDQSDKIGRKKNENELQKYLKSFLKGELKQIVDNFVKINKVNDPHLAERAKAFQEIFNTKFSKLFGVVFKLNRGKFMELIRVNNRTINAATELWNEASAKYEFFKSHGVLNSELLKGFVKSFLKHSLIQKEIQFFMMYHFDMIHDFDTSKLIVQTEQLDEHAFDGDTSLAPNTTNGFGDRTDDNTATNVFNTTEPEAVFGNAQKTSNKDSLNNLLKMGGMSKLDEGMVISSMGTEVRSNQNSTPMQSKIVQFLE